MLAWWWEAEPRLSTCPAANAWLFGCQQRKRVHDRRSRTAGSPGQRGKEVGTPWSPLWKLGEAGSFCSSTFLFSGWSCPSCQPLHPNKMPVRLENRYRSRGSLASVEQTRQEMPRPLSAFPSCLGTHSHEEDGSRLFQGRGQEDSGEGLADAKDRACACLLGRGAG